MRPYIAHLKDLTEKEMDILDAWQERMHEVYLERGEQISLIHDGMPMLVALAETMLPRRSERAKHKSIDKIFIQVLGAIKLFHSQAEGSA